MEDNTNSIKVSTLFFSTLVGVCGSLAFGHDINSLNTANLPIKCWIYVNTEKNNHENFSYQKCLEIDDFNNQTIFDFDKVVSQWALVSAIPSAGAIIMGTLSFLVSDTIGRLKSQVLFLVIELLSVITTVIARYMHSYTLFVFGRFFVGLAFGGNSCVTAIYMQEVAPEKYRNFFGSLIFMSFNIAVMSAQVLGIPEIFGTAQNWQFCVGFSVIYSVIGLISAIFACDSPIFEGREIKLTLKENITKFKVDLKAIKKDKTVVKMIIFMGINVAICHAGTGVPALLVYSSEIYSRAGFDATTAGLFSFGLNGSNLLASLILGCLIVRLKLKRHILLLVGIQSLCLILIAVFSHYINNSQNIFAYLAIIMTYLTMFSANLGSFPIPVILPVEYLDENGGKRGLSAAFNGFCGWGSTFVLIMLFPIIVKEIDNWAFLILAGVSFIGMLYQNWTMVEPRGKGYQEIYQIYDEKKGYYCY